MTRLVQIWFVALVGAAANGCGAVDVPGSSSPSTQTRPDPAPVADATASAPSDLVSDVEAALRKLTVPPETSAAIDLISTVSGNEFLRDCVMAAGYKERQIPIASILGGSFESTGVSLGWHEPIDLELAESGLGFHPDPTRKAGARLIYTDPEDPNDFEDSEEQVRYDQEFQKCTEQLESPALVDWTEIWNLQDEVRLISLRSTELPEFEPIRRKYVDCLRARGITLFSDPNDALEIVKNLPPNEGAVEAERAIAVGDATCRAPVYADFVNLAVDEWQSWLSARQKDTDRIAAHWQLLIDESGIRDLPRIAG